MLNQEVNKYSKQEFDVSRLKFKDVLITFKNDKYVYLKNGKVIKLNSRLSPVLLTKIILDIKQVIRKNKVIAKRSYWKDSLKLTRQNNLMNTRLYCISNSRLFTIVDLKKNDLIILINDDLFTVDSDLKKMTNINYSTNRILIEGKFNEIKAVIRNSEVVANRKNIQTGHNVQKRKDVLNCENL